MGEKTDKNLADAFAGESQANRKYTSFSKKAQEEGNDQVAKLFKAAATSEAVHARNHLKASKTVGTTEKNLEAAVSGEDYEKDTMYPEMIKVSEEEGVTEATTSFSWAMEVEGEHSSLFAIALAQIRENIVEDYYVCGGCGHVHSNEAPAVCPVCGGPKSGFTLIGL